MAFFRRLRCVCGLFLLLALVCEARPFPTPSGFVQTNNTDFIINGSPFFFNGFNSYWMMHVASEPTERYKVSNVLRDAAAAGLSVCRTWAFSDGGDNALQISPGVYDERVFQALDFVIAEAQKNGLYLILTLSNSWEDFGGRAQYVNWSRSAGESVSSDDDFYTNPVVQGYYKNHVKRVLTRINTITGVAYKDDPTIMAWELINEPRCKVDYSGATINGWVQEMAPYLKSIDNNHLLAIGMEGFYGDSIPERKHYNPGYQVGTDFISNNLVDEIDFATIHSYPNDWISEQLDDNSQIAFTRRWMISHEKDSRMILKKPLAFAEFGKSKKDPGYNLNARNSLLNTVYTDIYNFAKTGRTIGGGLVWQLVAQGMESFCDGYEIVLSQDPSTSTIIARQSKEMTSLQ